MPASHYHLKHWGEGKTGSMGVSSPGFYSYDSLLFDLLFPYFVFVTPGKMLRSAKVVAKYCQKN